MNVRVKTLAQRRDEALKSDLRRGLPDSLRQARPIKRPFDHARDPLISAQLKDQEKTEAQRREEAAGRGSNMVKLHKPFPELRPRHEQGPLRNTFNQAWLREQREALLARLRAEDREQQETPAHEPSSPIPSHGRER